MVMMWVMVRPRWPADRLTRVSAYWRKPRAVWRTERQRVGGALSACAACTESTAL